MRSTRARVWGEEHKMTKETLLSVEDLSVAFSQGGSKNLAVDRITFDSNAFGKEHFVSSKPLHVSTGTLPTNTPY